eukprot:TRINITY_DN15439_c0_g1_i1.p1 TRINITY_DN15439_c0_g1~~TRINITY_DN15439_c0_g1_i1.p1  ORF type:complete len:164 (+),score=2.27 TRINITY_DN15439_c0_g1_i1:191-682(+)
MHSKLPIHLQNISSRSSFRKRTVKDHSRSELLIALQHAVQASHSSSTPGITTTLQSLLDQVCNSASQEDIPNIQNPSSSHESTSSPPSSISNHKHHTSLTLPIGGHQSRSHTQSVGAQRLTSPVRRSSRASPVRRSSRKTSPVRRHSSPIFPAPEFRKQRTRF